MHVIPDASVVPPDLNLRVIYNIYVDFECRVAVQFAFVTFGVNAA